MLTPVRMPGEWQKPKASALQLPKLQPDPSRIAVLLNRNARKVTDDVVRHASRIVGSDHVFLSKSLDEAEAMETLQLLREIGALDEELGAEAAAVQIPSPSGG